MGRERIIELSKEEIAKLVEDYSKWREERRREAKKLEGKVLEPQRLMEAVLEATRVKSLPKPQEGEPKSPQGCKTGV